MGTRGKSFGKLKAETAKKVVPRGASMLLPPEGPPQRRAVGFCLFVDSGWEGRGEKEKSRFIQTRVSGTRYPKWYRRCLAESMRQMRGELCASDGEGSGTGKRGRILNRRTGKQLETRGRRITREISEKGTAQHNGQRGKIKD